MRRQLMIFRGIPPTHGHHPTELQTSYRSRRASSGKKCQHPGRVSSRVTCMRFILLRPTCLARREGHTSVTGVIQSWLLSYPEIKSMAAIVHWVLLTDSDSRREKVTCKLPPPRVSQTAGKVRERTSSESASEETLMCIGPGPPNSRPPSTTLHDKATIKILPSMNPTSKTQISTYYTSHHIAFALSEPFARKNLVMQKKRKGKKPSPSVIVMPRAGRDVERERERASARARARRMYV